MTAADGSPRLSLGTLEVKTPGARGLEHMARNPSCQRLMVLTLAQVGPNQVASKVLGEGGAEKPSPLALGRGSAFEREVLGNHGGKLLELYRRAGRHDIGAGPVIDLHDRVPASRGAAGFENRLELTKDLLVSALVGRPLAPVLAHAALAVEVAGVRFRIEADYLVADGNGFYVPGEIKSYADRAGETDMSDVHGACRQAAVAAVALRQVVGAPGAATRPVRAACDLVLRKVNTNQPTLWSMKLEGEVDSLTRAFATAPGVLTEAHEKLQGMSLDDPAALSLLPNNYVEGCREHCGLASSCKREAAAACDPVLLGNQAREQLLPLTSLSRALRLIQGGMSDGTLEERAAVERFGKLVNEYRKVATHGQ